MHPGPSADRAATSRRPPRRAALGPALVGAAVARGVLGTSGALPPAVHRRLDRTNHRGAPVSLLAGPALALAAAAGTGLPRRAALLAALGAGAVGAYDDLAGSGAARGFRGHLAALRRGQLTTGGAKVLGIGAAGLLAVAALPGPPAGRRGPLALAVDGAVVAGAANLLNLLDVRPGRALKAGLAASLALGEPGPAAAVAALLPEDLAERTMLGDTGANALGALLGLALVARTPHLAGRVRALAVLVALTGASEVVSFTRVIDAVPPLRALDRLGRLPAP